MMSQTGLNASASSVASVDSALNMSLHIPDHIQKVMSCLSEQRKSSPKLCDVVLQVDGTELHAHRSVLAASSLYFLAMFNGELIESTQRMVTLHGATATIIEILIEFAYTGMLDVTAENIQEVLAASTLFQFSEVCVLCCGFLGGHLDVTNCVDVRKFAGDHGASQFFQIVDTFILEHFEQVAEHEDFVALPYEVLLKVVQSVDLCVTSEEQVYSAVIKWVHHDLPERGYLLQNLLAHIRLPLLSIDFIMLTVESETLTRRSLECRDLIDEAKNFHLQPENHAKFRSPRTVPRKSTTGFLYAIGGKEAGETITDKCERYNMYMDRWEAVSSLSVPRQQLGVCALKDRIYAIAGSDGSNRLNSAEVYSQDRDVWEPAAMLKTCRSGVGVGVLGDSIFALGGYDGRLCLESVERYDTEVDAWNFVSPLNQTRSFPGVTVLGGRLFVIGGNDGTTFLSSCEVYDPLSNRWSSIAPMQRPRAGIGAAVVDGLLYVAGGFDGIRRLDLVECYESRMNAWLNVASMKYCRDGVSLCKYGANLYAIGGIDGPSYLNCTEFYDRSADAWMDVAPMQTSRAAAGVAILRRDAPTTIAASATSDDSSASLC